MMDNYNRFDLGSPHGHQNQKNVFSSLGKIISNQGYDSPQHSKPMPNRISSNILDTANNQYGHQMNPRHKTHESLPDNIGRDEHRKYLRDKLFQARNNDPNALRPSLSYSHSHEKLLNAERYPAAKEYAMTPMANRYSQPISGSSYLPNIHGPPQYHNSPYNQYYDQSPYQSGQNELRATLDKQTRILEKISKAVDNDGGDVNRNRHREREPNDLFSKFSTFEKEMELKMKLMNQKSLLERLQQNQNQNQNQHQNQHQNYNQNQNQYYSQNVPRREIVPDNAFTFNQNIPMPPKQEPPSEFKDYLLQFQGYLISHISASANLMNYQYQQMQQMYANYGHGYNGYGYGDEEMEKNRRSKKKSKKDKSSSKKKPKEDSPPQEQSGSQDKPVSNKVNDSKVSDKKTSKTATQRNPSLKLQDTGLYTDRKVSRQGTGDIVKPVNHELAKKNLRKILWTVAYPKIVKKDVAKRVQDRKDALMKNLIDSGEPAEKSLAVWMLNLIEKPLKGFINDKKNYDFIGSPETGYPTNSDMKERSNSIKNLVENIITLFSRNVTNSVMEKDGLEYLASVVLGERYALDKTLFNYELMRLNFNSYGRYIGVTPDQSNMLLTCFLVVRLLVFELLISAKKWNDTVEWTNTLQNNVKILASVIYRIALFTMDEKLQVINLQPASWGIVPRPPEKSNDKNDTPVEPDDPDMILDLYENEKLNLIFFNTQWVGTIQKTLSHAIDIIYNKVVEYRQQNPLKQGQTGSNQASS